MSKRKKQTGRYVVEINDWGCGTLIKDTLTGKEIDAPAEETVNLCLAEMNRLAAEVERLTFDPLTYLDDQGEWMPRHIYLAAVERLQAEVESVRQVALDNKTETEATRIKNARLKAELTDCKVEADRLKAEVEMLRKAGDALLHEWSSGDEKEARNFMKALVIWNAAKEGKPSV